MNRKYDISIIIVNYNTIELTLQCIDSIEKHSIKKNYEIIVVDNASTDNSQSVLSNDSRIKYIYLSDNIGFGRANNIGVNNSSGDFLFFLNSDTIIKNDVLSFLYNTFKSVDKIGAIGCILTDKKGIQTHSFGNFITIKSELNRGLEKYLEKVGFHKKSPIKKDIILPYKEVDYITGADLFISRKLFLEIGGFDSEFFMYCEEVDLQERLSQLGYKRIIISDPQIVHLEGGSDEGGSKKKWSFNRHLYVIQSKNIYLKKRHRTLTYTIFKILNTVILFPAILFKDFTWVQKLKLISALLK